MEYGKNPKLSHKQMIAYAKLKSPKKSDKALSDDIAPSMLKTFLARGLIAYANETSPGFGGTVAEWCAQRLRMAQEIFRDDCSNPLSSDATVNKLCYALQIISWCRYSTRDCQHVLLCKQAYRLILHGIAEMASLPRSKQYIDKLGEKLEEDMAKFIRGEESKIFTSGARPGHSPAGGLSELIQEVKRAICNE